jgi:hypothetical protein
LGEISTVLNLAAAVEHAKNTSSKAKRIVFSLPLSPFKRKPAIPCFSFLCSANKGGSSEREKLLYPYPRYFPLPEFFSLDMIFGC